MPMREIDMVEAQTNFAVLLENLDAPFVVAKDGKPLATVAPYACRR
ncbi:MAG: hypothetical protein LBP75_00090 [Planctomycetota bacterium]|jgi:hypothetical protein|nr:hypothetical protein [Planctomycetota bacterium]